MLQERIKRDLPSIELFEDFQEQDRGFPVCCETVRVLAGGGLESWKNDMTSAWVKLSQPSDTFAFILKKKVGISFVPTTNYIPAPIAFVNESDAFYITILWSEVQNLEQNGCFQIVIQRNAGGFIEEKIWRNSTYELKDYTIQNAKHTARIRTRWNLTHKIEGIDFTGSNVEDSIRFFGQIRKDQPNTKYRNVTQQNRRIQPVISEKSQTWVIETDGYTDPMLKLLENLFLLSPAEMWIADHNAHTNSYNILDQEVALIDEESTPEREPDDRFARQEVLTCKVGKRVRNEKTYY